MGGAINLIAVDVQMESQSIRLSVHDAVEWQAPADLLKMKLAPADIPIAHELARLSTHEASDSRKEV